MIPDHRWENLFSDLFIYCRKSQSDYSVMTNQTGRFFLNHAAFMSHIISPSLLTFFTHWLIYYNFFFFFGSSFLWKTPWRHVKFDESHAVRDDKSHRRRDFALHTSTKGSYLHTTLFISAMGLFFFYLWFAPQSLPQDPRLVQHVLNYCNFQH